MNGPYHQQKAWWRVNWLVESGWGRKTRAVNRTAQDMGVSPSTIWRWLRDANIQRLLPKCWTVVRGDEA